MLQLVSVVAWLPFAAPSLAVRGREDRLIPRADGAECAEGVPGAMVEILDDCGHLPPFEHPERRAEIALTFVEGG